MAKKTALYGILTAAAIVCGYIEALISLPIPVPGIKLGLANCISLTLLCKGDRRGAFLVNTVRTVLSALLFSGPFSLMLSLPAGLISLTAAATLAKSRKASVLGLSVAGAAVHNVVQLCVACAVFGSSVWYYLPFLLISALVCGCLTGLLDRRLLKSENLKALRREKHTEK